MIPVRLDGGTRLFGDKVDFSQVVKKDLDIFCINKICKSLRIE